ncbi:MAG: hypothetical protein HKN25_17965 [Pyrinomonadaceae bacterium]|nr:hypothetical protein [Pyrinomonadaceae bacterium]
MNLFTRIICLVLLLSALIFLVFQTTIKSQSGSVQTSVTARAEQITGDKFRYESRTPKGVKIFSVKKPGNQMIAAIDKGFDDLFAISRKTQYKYRKRLRHSDYMVYISRPDRLTNKVGKYSPDLAVTANQYAGSKYDQGGFVYAAGMVVAFSPCAFVIPEHTRDFKRVSDVVRYEGEHLVLYHNNRTFFNRTADHSKGGGHPILK